MIGSTITQPDKALHRGFDRVGRVRGVVLLAGTVRQSRLVASIGRSPLDLPVSQDSTVFDLWRDQIRRFADRLGLPPLACRLLVGTNASAPVLLEADQGAQFSVDADPAKLRGTGGLLRDLAEHYEDEDLLIVAAAAQLLLEPVEWFAEEAMRLGADVTILADQAGNPASLFVIGCRALRNIAPVGFVDLKEQALPQIAKSHTVRVISHRGQVGLPVRTAASYLGAVHEYRRRTSAAHEARMPFAERWKCEFVITEPGARVDPSARLHNSVVLRGASVAAGSAVANSIICPGGRVEAGMQVVDRVVTASGSFQISD